jgi:hypothetical protein
LPREIGRDSDGLLEPCGMGEIHGNHDAPEHVGLLVSKRAGILPSRLGGAMMSRKKGRVAGLPVPVRALPDCLPPAGFGARERAMGRLFDMDDRARLPWRFFGRMVTRFARG